MGCCMQTPSTKREIILVQKPKHPIENIEEEKHQDNEI